MTTPTGVLASAGRRVEIRGPRFSAASATPTVYLVMQRSSLSTVPPPRAGVHIHEALLRASAYRRRPLMTGELHAPGGVPVLLGFGHWTHALTVAGSIDDAKPNPDPTSVHDLLNVSVLDAAWIAHDFLRMPLLVVNACHADNTAGPSTLLHDWDVTYVRQDAAWLAGQPGAELLDRLRRQLHDRMLG